MNETFMKERQILPLVLTMSLPMVISMLVNSLYNIIDSYFVAQISEEAMTALSLVYPLQNLVSAVGVGFGVGLNAAIAYFLGAQRFEKANDATSQGLILSFVHGVILTAGCLLVIPAFLGSFTTSQQVISYGIQYSHIVFSFAIVINVEIAFEKIFQAVGKMTVSMISMMTGCVVNIILDPVLIFGLGPFPEMKIAGAAIATVIGQLVTLAIYLIIFLKRPMPLKIQIREQKDREKLYQRLYSVGIPATLNMALPSLLITVLNGILAAYSQMYVLVLGIYYKLQLFIYLTANGIVQGIRPLVGYNYGAGEHKRVRNIFKTALGLAAVVMAVGTILCMAFPDWLMALFTQNEQTIGVGATALRTISVGFIASAVSVTVCGTLEGLGKGMESLLISLMRYVIIMIPMAFFLSRLLGPTGVWHGFWVTELLVGIASFYIYWYNVREKKKQ